MIVILILTCVISPYRIAFGEPDLGWEIALTIMDLLFLADIIVTFNLAYYDSNFHL